MTERDMKSITNELIQELKSVAEGEVGWADIPDLVLHGMRFLVGFTDIDGPMKRRIVTQALVIICPNDDLDLIIPPMVNTMWPLIKTAHTRGWCEIL